MKNVFLLIAAPVLLVTLGFDFAFESFRRTLARRTPVEHSAWGT